MRCSHPLLQVLYLHSTLDTSNASWRSLLAGDVSECDAGNELAKRLAVGCEVLLRMRNSAVNVKELDSTVNAVLAVLRCRGDGAPVHLSVLEQSVCLLHTLCWCSVDSSEHDASNQSIGRRGRKCLALEDGAFAQRIADQCAEPVCDLLLEEHARSPPILLCALRAMHCAPHLSRPGYVRRTRLLP